MKAFFLSFFVIEYICSGKQNILNCQLHLGRAMAAAVGRGYEREGILAK